MRETLQLIGAILAIVIAIIGYILAILRYKSINRNACAEAWLIYGISKSSLISLLILWIFVGVSLIF